MKKILAFITLLMMFAVPVSAAEPQPELHSVSRIPWAIDCMGHMPRIMIISLCVIAVLLIASVIYYRKGGKSDEQ